VTASSATASWKTWGRTVLLGPDVHGATIGIVGFGRIGQAVAQRAQGFGWRSCTTICSRFRRRDTGAARGVRICRSRSAAAQRFVSLHVNLFAGDAAN
jgi:glyoxylate reductase